MAPVRDFWGFDAVIPADVDLKSSRSEAPVKAADRISFSAVLQIKKDAYS